MWSVQRRNDKNVQMMLDSNSFQISRMRRIPFLVLSQVLPHHSKENSRPLWTNHKQKNICGWYAAGMTIFHKNAQIMFDPDY